MPGAHSAVLQGHRQVSNSDDEAWLRCEFEIIDDHRAGKIVVNLTGRLNKCAVISPRFDAQLKDLEKWQNNLLPPRQCGFIVLTTSAQWRHGPRSKTKTYRRENPWIFFLGM